MFPVAVLPASRYPQSPTPAAYPVLARSPVSRLPALLPLTVISLSDGHSLVNVLHTRSEVLKEIHGNPVTRDAFRRLNGEFWGRFVEFCMGVRGVKMSYDPFFKKIFNAEIYPERLSRFLTEILGRPLEVKRMLPNERQRITDMGSLMTMDLLVEFETGELADVEIQKIGYRYPGPRASCYTSDMVMRQYERVKGRKGEHFTYRDMKKVYTIVIMEESSREIKEMPGYYIHHGKYEYDTRIDPGHLERICYIALDNFLDIMDNKRKGT